MKRLLWLAATLALAGCNGQGSVSPENHMVWFGADCTSTKDTPEALRKFQLAADICMNKAAAAGEASIANIPSGPNLGTAVAAGIQSAQTRSAVAVPTALACMGERGYMLKPLPDARVLCPALAAKYEAEIAKGPARQ